MKLSLSICLILLMFGCDPIDERLLISNNSDEIIFYLISPRIELDGQSPFKNSFEIVDKDTVWDETSNLVFPSSSKTPVIIGRNGWEDFINEDCQDNKLKVFIFQKSLISKVPWDTIVANQQFSKKYELTIEDLERNNWQVKYE